MSKIRMLFALALLGAAVTQIQAQDQQPVRGKKSQEAAAAQGLALFRALAGDKSRELGLASGGDAARATLGTPLAVLNVELDALRRFKPGDDASALLKASASAFYPIVIDGGVRSAVRVESADGNWEAARVGNAGLATAVDRARRALPKPDDAVSLVQVLALNLVFVAQRDERGWMLAPVIDDASVELKVGQAETAATVFARLAPLAVRQNGEPT